jgi:hypothetical protein
MSGQIKYCNKVWTANGCTHAHDDVAGQELGTRNPSGFRRTVACMFATPDPTKTGGGGGGGGGGHVSPPRAQKVVHVEAPWAPKAPTYAQRAQSKPEMPDWMIEGKKLENEFPDIKLAKMAYMRAVETASAAKKAAEAAAQEAYKAALKAAAEATPEERTADGIAVMTGHARGGGGSFGDAADSEEE